jgi:hypothetical protein
MPTYEIEQYELCITKYRVKASSEAKAIAKLLNGNAEPIDNSHEYVEVAHDFGLPVDENRGLADELEKLGVSIGEDVIPSIRSVVQID